MYIIYIYIIYVIYISSSYDTPFHLYRLFGKRDGPLCCVAIPRQIGINIKKQKNEIILYFRTRSLERTE